MEIGIQNQVKNNRGQIGVITSIVEGKIIVSFSGKEMKFQEDAFLKGYLSYVDSSSQKEVEEEKAALQMKEAEHAQAVKEAESAAIERAKRMAQQAKEAANKKLNVGEDVSNEHNVILLRKQPAWSDLGSDAYQRQCNCLDDYRVIDIEKGYVDKEDGGKVKGKINLYDLGPVETEDGQVCANLGFYWELSKVFRCHSDGGVPNKEYFAYRQKMLKKSLKAQNNTKHPWSTLKYEVRGEVKKYKDEECLYHAYYDKQTKTWKALQENEARRVILLENYVRLVSKNEAYLKLKEEVEQGKKLALIAPNAFNFYSEAARKIYWNSCLNKYKGSTSMYVPTYERLKEINSVKDLLELNLPFSHVAILKAMLDGDLAYDEASGKVLDRLSAKEVEDAPEKKEKRQ